MFPTKRGRLELRDDDVLRGLLNDAQALEAAARFGDAAVRYRQLLAVIPSEPGLLGRLGLTMLRTQAPQPASRLLGRAVCISDSQSSLWSAFGDSLRMVGADGAGQAYRRSLALSPSEPAVLMILADIAADLAKAFQIARRSLAVRSDDGASLFSAGTIAAKAAQPRAAMRLLRKALCLAPQLSPVLTNVGSVALMLGDSARAIVDLGRAIACDQDAFDALDQLANLVYVVGRSDRGIQWARRAIIGIPGRSSAWVALGNAYKLQGRVSESATAFRRAADIEAASATAYSSMLFALCFLEGLAPEELYRLHRRFEQRYASSLKPVSDFDRIDLDPDRPLKVGYLSPDFRIHPGGHFLLPMVRHHDRRNFAVTCYSLSPDKDLRTETFAAASRFVDCTDLDDEALARRIADDGVDILIECAGHMAGNRLLACARRPAPIQVNFPLYPATTGLRSMDYRIMDAIFAPPGADALHSERIIRMPDCVACYEPLPGVDPPDHPPSVDNGFVTFGCFNNVAKLGTTTIDLWSRVLRENPTSKLMLKWLGLAEGLPQWLLAAFARNGVTIDRIEFRSFTPHPYTAYREIDVALDPLHANGGTTTCDALWMGVPVLTLQGDQPFSRIASSLLTTVGLPELITHTERDYLSTAARLVHDPAFLKQVRAGLRERFAASPVADGDRYVRNLEAEFRKAWRRYGDERRALRAAASS